MELINLGMNDPTSIYGNFTFYLVKYGEPEFDTILKFVGEVPDKHDYLTADGYYEEHSVNEIVFLFEYIYSEDKRKFLRFYYALEKDFTANREKLYYNRHHYCIIKNCGRTTLSYSDDTENELREKRIIHEELLWVLEDAREKYLEEQYETYLADRQFEEDLKKWNKRNKS